MPKSSTHVKKVITLSDGNNVPLVVKGSRHTKSDLDRALQLRSMFQHIRDTGYLGEYRV